MIAKYRKVEYPGEWWLTDFTMEQVEKRLEQSEITIRILCDKISKLESTLAAAQECIKELEAEVRAYQRSGDFRLDDDTAENKRLRAENERLREAVEETLKFTSCRGYFPDCKCHYCNLKKAFRITS